MHNAEVGRTEPGRATTREARLFSRSLKRLVAQGSAVRLNGATDTEYPEVQRFIAARFREFHGASITCFHPLLLSIRCNGRLAAALGINPAAGRSLFLEQYLDQPAEQAVARVTKTPVSRDSIVEIGNLVTRLNGATAPLYLLLLAMIYRAGYQWVMFTATPAVERSIEKLGFSITPVCAADPGRLANPEQWGSYYDVRPRVMVGLVRESFLTCVHNSAFDEILPLTGHPAFPLAEEFAGP